MPEAVASAGPIGYAPGSPESRVGVARLPFEQADSQLEPLHIPNDMLHDIIQSPVVEQPDQAAGTAGVYRSHYAEASREQEITEPLAGSELFEGPAERVRAVARPLGNVAARGVAVLARENYVHGELQGLLFTAHQAQLAAIRTAEQAVQDALMSPPSPTAIETKKAKEKKRRLIDDITLEDLLGSVFAAARERRSAAPKHDTLTLAA